MENIEILGTQDIVIFYTRLLYFSFIFSYTRARKKIPPSLTIALRSKGLFASLQFSVST